MKTVKRNFSFKVFVIFIQLFLILIVSDQSFGQLKNLGIKGGLNISNASIDYSFDLPEKDSKTGFNVYLFYNFLKLKNVVLSTEAGFSKKGFTEPFNITNEKGIVTGTSTLHSSVDYVDISALAQFILRCNSVSPYFSIGPVLSIKTGYSISADGNIDSTFNDIYDPLLDQLKSPVLGLMTGVGIEINKIIPQTLLIEARYNFDLTNSFKNMNVEYKRNYLLQFNAGIKF